MKMAGNNTCHFFMIVQPASGLSYTVGGQASLLQAASSAPAKRAQPQCIELDETGRVAMVVSHSSFLEGYEVLIVQ